MQEREIIIILIIVIINICLYFRGRQNRTAVIYFIIGEKAGELVGAEDMWNALYRDIEQGKNKEGSDE